MKIEMKEHSSNLNIKFKLIFGYSLIILAVVVAAFFSYISFTKLLDSVEELTEPDTKSIKLNQILTDISEAESSTRSYILTRDKSYLDNYYEYVASINKNINELRILTQVNESQYLKVDSIDRLFGEKVESLNSFIDLKNSRQNTDFSSRALKQITKNARDSARKTTTLTTTTEVTTIKPFGPLGKEEEEEKGLFDVIKKIFTGKEADEADTTKAEDVLTETKITVDTMVTSEYQPDTILSNVKRILSNLQAQETRFNRLLTTKELEMLKKDSHIMSSIRTIIKELEEEERALSESKAAEAKMVADTFSKTILTIGIIALIAGIIFILLILHDVNKSNFYKKQLLAAKRHAEQLARIKEDFLSNMSHEIRTPLNAIIGFSEQLYGTRLSTRQHEFLHAVRTSSDHLLSTVNDILDFQKIEAGKLKIEKIPFRMYHVIREVYQSLKLKADEKQLKIVYTIEQSLEDMTLEGDPFRLKQVLFNLISNAIKFTDQGNVKILCHAKAILQNKLLVKIVVEDTGIGIPEDKMEHIFQGFSQADATTTRKYGGTGLGLSISKKLVEMQDGKLSVESTPGKGSVFSIEIPYVITEAAVAEISHQSPLELNTIPLEDKFVLIVDDDEFNVSLAGTILSKWKVNCATATNGHEALEMIKKENYDLILTDLHMPGMSGLDLAKNIRRLNDKKSTVPIIALTANVAEKVQRHLLENGMDDLLLKPFKETDLYQKLTHYLVDTNGCDNEKQNGLLQRNSDDQPYSLQDLKAFSGGDDEMLLAMINTLLEDQLNNVQQMNGAFKEKDWQKIGAYAHKMIPSFAYLKAEPLTQILREIDHAIQDGVFTKAVLEKTSEVIVKAAHILELLAKEIIKESASAPVKS